MVIQIYTPTNIQKWNILKLGHATFTVGHKTTTLKSVFLDLNQNGYRYSLAVKTIFFTHYVSYLNPESKVYI